MVLWWLHMGSALLSAAEAFPAATLPLRWDRKSLGIEASRPVFRGLIPDQEPEGDLTPADPQRELELLVDESLAASDAEPKELLEVLRSLRLGNPLLVEVARFLDGCLARVVQHSGASLSDTVEIQ